MIRFYDVIKKQRTNKSEIREAQITKDRFLLLYILSSLFQIIKFIHIKLFRPNNTHSYPHAIV